jgi:peptidyl-Lys metalloendopeptidase
LLTLYFLVHLVAHAYNFTASGAASYNIYAKNTFYIVNADSKISTLHADADSYSAKISGKLAVARSTLVKRATYNGCTSAQQSSIVSAASAAQNYAAGAFSYANSLTSSTPRYMTWFGAYTAARHSTVVSHYSAINSIPFSSYNFDCSTCTEADVYAYVQADE